MNKLALVALAASASLISATSALAQHRSGGHGGGVRGHMSGGHGGMRGHMGGGHRGGMSGHRGGHRGGVTWHRGGSNWGHHQVRTRHHGRHFRHPGRNFRHHRMNRGFFINAFWFGPQFHVTDWQLYGFSNPGDDGRWVRYYDDAYLIDREGRIRDYRYDMDWSRYGERWEDDDGIPAYAGRHDYRPGDEDDEDGEDAERHGGPPPPGPGWDYRQHGHGQVGYPGYGYYAYPIVIETTVTTSGGYTEQVVEEVVQTRRAHRARCNCRRAAPRHRPAPPRRPPPAGERG